MMENSPGKCDGRPVRQWMGGGHHRVLIRWMLVIVMAGLIGVAWGCRDKKPIKIGYVGSLTGRLSDLSISGRDGVLLAVEEINQAGGIKGHQVELISKDDKNDVETALKVDRELIDGEVAAIIGHMTSAMCTAALPLINREKVLMVSPTASTNTLKGIDDYFIRVLPPNRAETDHLTRVACDRFGLKRMAVAYDLSNRAYSEEFFNNFREEFEKNDRRIILAYPFTSGVDGDLKGIAEKLLEPGPDGILIIAGALDAAIICQHLRKNGFKHPLFSGGWAMTADFIQHGGPAVEGVIFSQLIDKDSREKSYLDFKNRFRNRFGYGPNFSAAHGYEAAKLILTTLKETSDPGELKQKILEYGNFPGVQGEIVLDRYGDPRRGRFLISVLDGEYGNLE